MDINALIKQVKDKGPDQTKASAGGGDFTPAAKGPTGCRLVGYYEVGQHAGEYQGQPKVNDTVKLVFELIGAKHPVREVDGQKIPVRVNLTLNNSSNEKAHFFKMFSRCRDEGDTHFVQLLGRPLKLNIVHVERERNGKKVTYANIDKETINKPIIQVINEETGDIDEKPMTVGPAVSDLKAFVWDFATPEMWDSIFIEGEYPERKDDDGKVTAPARSKNVLQNEIASALNFKALPCYDYAVKNVTKEDSEALDAAVGDVDSADAAPEEPAAADPLEGIA